jgi:Rrf2 family protein
MRLTRGCGYALRALEYLPPDFLPKALQPLVRAGLLRSLQGPNGGFWLARPLSQITLLEVVEAVDGPIRGEAPPAQARWAGFDPRLAAVCQGVADRVRRQLGKVRVSDLVGKT